MEIKQNRLKEEIITNKIAKAVADKSIVNKEGINVERYTLVTYHQLINWIFKSLELLDTDEPVYCPIKWIKEWYTLLKDCPLKYEFKGRLREWFKNTCNVEIVVRPSIEEDYYSKYEVDIYPMKDYATLIKTFTESAARKEPPVLYDNEEKSRTRRNIKTIWYIITYKDISN